MITKQHFQIFNHSRSSLPAGWYAMSVTVLPLDVPLSENTVKNMCAFIICLLSTFMKSDVYKIILRKKGSINTSRDVGHRLFRLSLGLRSGDGGWRTVHDYWVIGTVCIHSIIDILWAEVVWILLFFNQIQVIMIFLFWFLIFKVLFVVLVWAGMWFCWRTRHNQTKLYILFYTCCHLKSILKRLSNIYLGRTSLAWPPLGSHLQHSSPHLRWGINSNSLNTSFVWPSFSRSLIKSINLT